MKAVGKNGVLVLSSVTGGSHRVEVDADKPAPRLILGNKVMVGTVNASRESFESGVRDLAHAESAWPGWLAKLLTHPVRGLENWREVFAKLHDAKGAIKVFCAVGGNIRINPGDAGATGPAARSRPSTVSISAGVQVKEYPSISPRREAPGCLHRSAQTAHFFALPVPAFPIHSFTSTLPSWFWSIRSKNCSWNFMNSSRVT